LTGEIWSAIAGGEEQQWWAVGGCSFPFYLTTTSHHCTVKKRRDKMRKEAEKSRQFLKNFSWFCEVRNAKVNNKSQAISEGIQYCLKKMRMRGLGLTT
jgi:hypothetical protein